MTEATKDQTNAELAKIVREWTPKSLATFYDWICAGSGMTFPDHLWPVACALCDMRIKRLMLVVGPGSGKSFLLSTVYPVWLLGHAPDHTIITVSGAESLAAGFVSGAMQYVKDSEGFRIAFPDVRPDKDLGWSPSNGMFVSGHRTGDSDASYAAFGLTSKALTGKHARTLIFDDLHTEQNSNTTEACAQVVGTYASQLVGRADARGARFILAGRRWHVDDLYGQLGESEQWVVMTLPAERPNSKRLWFDITVPDHLECVFTDGFCYTQDDDIVEVAPKVPKAVPVEKKYKHL
jgi:hypothetical protein